MSFEEFQNQARLYVIGALEADETKLLSWPKNILGKKQKITSPNATMHEAFALSLRPAKSSEALKERLMAMVRKGEEAIRDCFTLLQLLTPVRAK